MRRLLGCAALMLALPFCVSRNTAITSPDPFPMQALAGHSTPGAWCECGAPGCICDPGEELEILTATSGQSNIEVSTNELTGQPLAPDFEAGLVVLILALFVTVRLRMR